MKVLFLVVCKKHHASVQVRVRQYLSYLAESGIQYELMGYSSRLFQTIVNSAGSYREDRRLYRRCMRWFLYRLSRLLKKIEPPLKLLELKWKIYSENPDVIFIQKVLVPQWFLNQIRKTGCSVVYDFDDAVYLNSAEGFNNMLRAANLVLAGNPYMEDLVRGKCSRVLCFPSTIDSGLFSSKGSISPSKKMVVGWLGGPSTIKYLDMVSEALRSLTSLGYSFTFKVVGDRGRGLRGVNLEGINYKLMPYYGPEDIPKIVQGFDIGLMPLEDSEHELGKCAMKALIYMAAGVPVVSSAVGEIMNIVTHNEDGFLVNDSEGWFNAIRSLLDSRELCTQIGQAGRTRVENDYSIDMWGKCLCRELLQLAGDRA